MSLRNVPVLGFAFLALVGLCIATKQESESERTKIYPRDQSPAAPKQGAFRDLAAHSTQYKMFPYGNIVGDTLMGTNDDACEKFVLSKSIKYIGSTYNKIWVCNNGLITFDGHLSWYTPRPMGSPSQSRRLIAAYWADIDTRFGLGGEVYYGQHTSGSLLNQGKSLVEGALQGISNFNPTIVVVVTWHECTFYGANAIGRLRRNTFQLVLVSDGPRTFGFKIYDKLQWTTGTASGGSANTGLGGVKASIGFSKSYNSNKWYQVPGFSFSSNALDMTQVTNIQGPFVSPWPGCWLDQYDLVGTKASIMNCLRDQKCCVMQGNRYQPNIPGCTKFYQWDYLNSTPFTGPQNCGTGTIFDTFPTICTCNHKANVDDATCMSML